MSFKPILNKIYTLDELLSTDSDYSKMLKEKIRFHTEIKSKKRHPVITEFKDFEEREKAFLLELKEVVFENNFIYVFGSRIDGKYLTDKEYEEYVKIYPNIKKSDWDIRSEFKLSKTGIAKLKDFEKKYNTKIEISFGNNGIKI